MSENSGVRIYVGFDDTDTVDADRGTGKLARWFERSLPDGCQLWGVVRQQLLVDPSIPYTSHNSSACAVVDCADAGYTDRIIGSAVDHIERYSLPGSDPGLCVMTDRDSHLGELKEFGLACTRTVVRQADAMAAVNGAHLSGHGGTHDGIIGAAAAVGLTVSGWSGRFIEYGRLREFSSALTVRELEEAGIGVITTDRDAVVAAGEDIVETSGWLRPRLLGGRAVLVVGARGPGSWVSMGGKRAREKREER